MRSKYLIPGMSICIAIAGCALPLVVTYGVDTKELSPGHFTFPLYYNADASDVDIDSKAAAITEDIRKENGYESCEFTRSPMADPWQNKRIDVSVICSGAPTTSH